MKTLKQIALAAMLGLAIHSEVFAVDTLYITGSTAYRAETHTAIGNVLNAGYTYAHVGGTFSSAQKAIFTGTLTANSQPVIIKTSWSGSTLGMKAVTQGLVTDFLPDTTPQSTGGTANATNVAPFDSVAPDAGMADSFQNATPFTSPTLTFQQVGILPFKWVVNEGGAAAGITNMTTFLAQPLYGNGDLPLSFWTGNSAHSATKVYAYGRDPGSGTRTVAFAESGVGSNAIVTQYKLTTSGDTITAAAPFPITAISGLGSTILGNGGESSGGTVAGAMGKTSATVSVNGGPASQAYFVAYVGITDSATAISAGATELTWNGVPYSLDNVKNGKYTFWSYQHVTYKSDIAAGKKAIADAIATNIKDVVSSPLLSEMNVVRTADGGTVTP
jgi:hypothetical protein